MRKRRMLSLLTAAVLAAGSLTACGGSGSADATKAAETTAAGTEAGNGAGESQAAAGEQKFVGQELKVSTFSFNAELLQKNIYDPFMAATGCKLIVEGGKNAERVTKIKESPANYDIVVIGDAYIKDLIDAGLVDTIDSSKLTNLDGLYDIAKAPFGEEYGPA